MRRSIPLVLALILALAVPASSQTVLSVNAGVNIASLNGDDAEGFDSRTGVNLGVAALFPLGETLGLYLGGSYSQKGAETSEAGVTGTLKLDYFEIPVLLRYGFPSSSTVSFHLYGGGALAFEASCEVEGSEGSVSATVDCSDVDLDSNTVDFGLTGGLGLDFEVSESVDLILDVFYTYGLTNIIDSVEAQSIDVKNGAFTIRAGAGFPIG